MSEASEEKGGSGSATVGSKKGKLQTATVGDIVLSIILPGWGIIVGVIALVKGEVRRAGTMAAISIAVLAICFALTR
jgi:hypothetical protein